MKNLGNTINKASKTFAISRLATLASAVSLIGLCITRADLNYIELAGATLTGSYLINLISGMYLSDRIGKAVEN